MDPSPRDVTRTNPSPYYPLISFQLFYPVTFLYKVAASIVLCRTAPKALTAPTPSTSPEKVAIVTGSNTGIGFETAKCLATQYGYTVILATRSRDKGERAAAQISNMGGNAIFVHPLDLSSFESVRQFARVIRQRYSTIHCLINNAGINVHGVSEDHLDLLFQSNFLGHYVLTAELWSILDKTNPARVVNVSSVMHHFCGKSDIESISFWKRVASAAHDGEHDVTKTHSYSLSKLAAILFSMELNRRYGNQVRSIAVNPGAVNSDIWRNFPKILRYLFSIIYLNVSQGSYTSVAAAVEDSSSFQNNCIYLQPYWMPSDAFLPFPPMEMLGHFVGYRVSQPRLPNHDNGSQAARALWSACEDITGVKWPQES